MRIARPISLNPEQKEAAGSDAHGLGLFPFAGRTAPALYCWPRRESNIRKSPSSWESPHIKQPVGASGFSLRGCRDWKKGRAATGAHAQQSPPPR